MLFSMLLVPLHGGKFSLKQESLGHTLGILIMIIKMTDSGLDIQ